MGRSSKKSTSLLGTFTDVYKETFAVLKETPTILALFIILAIVDGIALTALFLSPSEPFLTIFGPIIRSFYSEQFLHYPTNFILLPKLYGHAHFAILCVLGIIVTGIVVQKIDQHQQGKKVATLSALGPVIKKYLSLLLIWFVSFFVFKIASDTVIPMVRGSMMIQVSVGFVLAVVIQSLFSFMMPAILLSDKGFLKAVLQAFTLSLKKLLSICLIIAIPVLALVLMSVAKSMSTLFVSTYPEAVLWILAFGILVSMFVDLMITSSTTLLYLKVRNER